jgi:hypothetical protein
VAPLVPMPGSGAVCSDMSPPVCVRAAPEATGVCPARRRSKDFPSAARVHSNAIRLPPTPIALLAVDGSLERTTDDDY